MRIFKFLKCWWNNSHSYAVSFTEVWTNDSGTFSRWTPYCVKCDHALPSNISCDPAREPATKEYVDSISKFLFPYSRSDTNE